MSAIDKELRDTGVAYALGALVMTFYGVEVCPFIETLPHWQLLLILSVGFGIGAVAKLLAMRHLRARELSLPLAARLDMPWRYLITELGVWLLVATVVGLWNLVAYGFPIVSGFKIILGCATLGLFSASYLALEAEHRIIRETAAGGLAMPDVSRGYVSITAKFLRFQFAALLFIAAVILLLMYKDFTYVIHAISSGEPFQFRWVVQEVLFVFGVLLVGSMLVVQRYSRNVRLIFEMQLRAFESVVKGNYETTVPAVTRDEFAVIAEHTNRMIAGLREKERIKTAFGKYLSPAVANTILASPDGPQLGGSRRELAVLFVDLRNFTPLSEQLSPEALVALLNDYFGFVVEAVHRNGGVVDKFIGDAALAVFGLDGKEHPCDGALATAKDIRRALGGFNAALRARGLPAVENGIGIHYGPVIAGNIGSAERLEFTVIGDAVNVAARLESLTKNLGAPLALSEAAYGQLSVSARQGLVALGSHALKGKSEPLAVYGLGAELALGA